ncbi:MAG: RDD family protein [Sulfitobacter sp.]|nr:RDD family protein [Sulfitobacter sp.]
MPTPSPDDQPEFYDGILTKRLIAWLIDSLIIILLCLLILPFTAFTGIIFFPVLMIFVGFFYRLATLASRSATWGMQVVAMELRDDEDRLFNGTTAFLHTAGYTISITVAPLQLISVVLMVTNSTRQGLTDMILGTVALNRRRNY